MTLEVSDKTEEMELRLRIPDWVVDGTPEVQIDGTKYDYKTRGGYIVIPADKVAEGTKITVKLPMEVTASNLPGWPDNLRIQIWSVCTECQTGNSKTDYHFSRCCRYRAIC